MTKLELFWPLKRTYISQGFGENLVPLYKDLGMLGHNGIDMAAPVGEPVLAAHDGVVTYAGTDSREGVGVVLRTSETYEYQGKEVYFKTIYWHLLSTIPVLVNQKVKIGDTIGFADTTGYAKGSHLHFGLKPIAEGENEWTWSNVAQNNGYLGAIDPEPYFSPMSAYQLTSIIRNIRETLSRVSLIIRLLILKKPL